MENNEISTPPSPKVEKKSRFKNKSVILFLLSLILIVVGLFGAVGVQSNFGKIDVSSFTLPTEDGQYVVADLYKPKSATSDNKAPCVIITPGFQRSKETQSAWSIELARRGIVVICIDPYNQGDSSSSNSSQAATTQGYGLFAMVDYVTSSQYFNYVNKDLVGAAGHSAGGNACVKAASRFGLEVIDGKVEKSRLASIYISGYIRSFTASDLTNIRSNMGMSYAYYDEGAYQNETQQAKDNGTWMHDKNIANGDMRYAPEAIRFVNSGLKLEGKPEISTKTGSIEIGTIYGNQYKNTLRYVNNEKTIHAMQPYDMKSIENMLKYFELSFDLEFSIAASSQVWLIKEIMTGMMLVGGLLFVLGLGALLLKTKFFATLVHALPNKANAQKPVDKVIFWVVFTVSALIACFLFIPMAQLAQQWFKDAQSGIQTWYFPQRMTNSIMLWAALNGTIGIALFFLTYFLRGKAHGTSLEAIKIKPLELAKSLLLALTVFSSFYLMILVIYTIFHVDFRFMFISARPILNPKMLIVALMYVPVFFIFYFSNSLRVNCSMRVENWSESTSQVIACLGNSVGLMLIMIIQYVVFAATGLVHWTTEWLYCNMLFGLIPMMIILPIFNRYFFNKTGKIYVGPMVSCLVFIMMTLTNTVCYLPI